MGSKDLLIVLARGHGYDLLGRANTGRYGHAKWTAHEFPQSAEVRDRASSPRAPRRVGASARPLPSAPAPTAGRWGRRPSRRPVGPRFASPGTPRSQGPAGG